MFSQCRKVYRSVIVWPLTLATLFNMTETDLSTWGHTHFIKVKSSRGIELNIEY